MKFSIYRFDPEKDKKPYMQKYDIALDDNDQMLLDALMKIKQTDETLALRKSCREGVCGSDSMNINGKNGLACVTKLKDLKEPVVIRPMPGLPVIKDLIVDMDQFFKNYQDVKPYFINNDPPPTTERLQSPEDRKKLDGLYECILCGACTTSCPSFWWGQDKFMGPAALLQSYRFLADSRDQGSEERLEFLDHEDRLFRCHNIMNCADVCPKGLSPAKAISGIKEMQFKNKKKSVRKIFSLKKESS